MNRRYATARHLAELGVDRATIAQVTGIEIVSETEIAKWVETLDPAHFNPPVEPRRIEQEVTRFAAFLDSVTPDQF